jgi:DNA-binding HxlR family transcriptional regulator
MSLALTPSSVKLKVGRQPSADSRIMPQVPPPKRHPYDQWSPDARALDLIGDKWTLLIVRDLASGPRRFVELQRVLPGISTEQLRSRLNRMVADGMLTRKRYREVPPRVDYELTPRAEDLMPILGELARWGYEWSWSAPRASESVDLGAIFRLAPGLIGTPRLRGSIELRVIDGNRDGSLASFTVTLAPERATVSESGTEHPDTVISGGTASWIDAIAPAHDRSGLEIAGDRHLAESVIGMLAIGSSQDAIVEQAQQSAVA